MSFKRPILAQLQNDLVNHIGNASDILSAAVQQLDQVLSSKIIETLKIYYLFLNNSFIRWW